MHVGKFIEDGILNGSINEEQVVCFYDKNNNVEWVGKAAFAPIYLNWIVLKRHEVVGNELRINEKVVCSENDKPDKIIKIFYSIEYARYGDLHTHISWFDDLAEARKFAKCVYAHADIKRHVFTNLETINHVESLVMYKEEC